MRTRAHTLSGRTRTEQVTKKYKQDRDRIAFAVATGAVVADGNQGSRMAEIGNRERASTGLLKVGGDALSHTSSFLSWEKVKLQRKWSCRAPMYGDVIACHVSPCSRMILTSSGRNLQLWDATYRDAAYPRLQKTFEGHGNSVNSCHFFPDGKTAVSASDVSASADKTLYLVLSYHGEPLHNITNVYPSQPSLVRSSRSV
jgi:WD40 repeat protein